MAEQTKPQKWTVNAIKKAVREAGSHWFDPGTMRFFGTEVMPRVFQGPGGVYFITKDNQFDSSLPKLYAIRQFNPADADISTVGKINEWDDLQDAQEEAERLAAGDGEAEMTKEDFKPVSVLEQFLKDIDAHSSNPSKVTERDAKTLMTNARVHHRLMEMLCSNEDFCKDIDEEGNHPHVVAQRKLVQQTAKRLGAKGVIFSGDPRGCTVKLTWEDGATNDFGKEGWCVPIDLEDEE